MFSHGIRKEVVSVWRYVWMWRKFWRPRIRARWSARHLIMSGRDARAFSHNVHRHGYMGTRPCDGSCEEVS